jgi:hypothetical protein
MAEILTLEEMARRYDGEWLLIAYTKLDEDLNVLRGVGAFVQPRRCLSGVAVGEGEGGGV